jgi:hypothetical protein
VREKERGREKEVEQKRGGKKVTRTEREREKETERKEIEKKK